MQGSVYVSQFMHVEPHAHRETRSIPWCAMSRAQRGVGWMCSMHLRYCVFMMNLVGYDPAVSERNLCSVCDYILLVSILK